ncbi:MAG: sensor histidine kinase [Clostridia bacterium]|nr:sensor histidine kinase [Clostridia bacterium]
MKNIKLVPRYLWQYKFVIFAFAIFAIIFAVICYLYHLTLEAALYTTLLCAVVAFVFVAIHFCCYCKKREERLRLLEHPMTIDLPSAGNLTEAELIEVIEKLRNQYNTDFLNKQNEREEYLNYYTMWMHQIKTPISAMGLMLQNQDTKENRALAGELFRIEQYVEMALWYLRIGDMSDMVLKTYELDEIIKEAVSKYAPLFVSKKIKLNYEPVNTQVITDKKWLSFIIQQLLSNAIKYTEKGSITIKVENKVLSVIDTGIGIIKEDIPRIFEKGYTGFNGRLERKSTGIGLYLCKCAADKLSHKLSAISEAGKGSEFSIDLNTYNLQVE